jgi:cobalt-zinc-cadmium efflux system membrane fusion protein
VALTFLIVALGAFLLGRRTSTPTPTASPGTEQHAANGGEKAEERPEEGGHAESAIKFSEEALDAAKLQVEPVSYRFLKSHLALTGTVEPNQGGVVKITPRVGGKITSIRANVGDNARAGQVLATLASTELGAAQAAYREAGSRIGVARTNLQRQRKLAGLGQFGRPRLEEARTEGVRAQGEVNVAQNEVAAARNEVAEARSEQAALEAGVASAEAGVASSQSEIEEAGGQTRALQAALSQAQTGVKVAESRFNRADRLLKDELVSRQDWEQAQADFQQAQAGVDTARANLSQGQAKVETAKAHLKAAQAEVRAARGRVQQAAAKVETALSRQSQVEARLDQARKQAEIAAQALAREERVFQGGFLTSKEIVDAEAAVRAAELERQAAADRIRLLGGTPGGGSEIAVTTPISGRVTERTVTLGETVTPEKPLLTIISLGTVWVQMAVAQGSLSQVRVGQPVTITSDTAPGRTFSGIVSYIGDVVDETTRTVKVRAVIQNVGGVLKPQTFVRGVLRTDRHTQALAVPSDAVQTYQGKSVVFVRGEHAGEFVPKEVGTGATEGGLTILTSGLQPGDRVVTRGAFTVKAQGMKSELGEE